MNCPYCNQEMIPGCIQSRDALYWSEEEMVVPALGLGGGKKIRLNGFSSGNLGRNSAAAYLCEACRKVIVEY